VNSTRGLLLDAFGTVLELESPVPALVHGLRDGWNVEVSPAEVERAFAAEVSYYKAHHLEGRDAASLADLRLRCSVVLRDNLPGPVREKIDPAELMPVFLGSLRFHPFDDVTAALTRFRSAGLGLAVVSDWDVSLDDVLDRCGLAPLIDHSVSTAEVGAAKPSPVVFERAAGLLGLEPASLLHIGDTPELDIDGATAAGIASVLIRRDPATGEHSDPGVPTIASLAELGNDPLTQLRLP
jgi:putative hydrolase of the HAD superfamily